MTLDILKLFQVSFLVNMRTISSSQQNAKFLLYFPFSKFGKSSQWFENMKYKLEHLKMIKNHYSLRNFNNHNISR